jgi:hypothetical protein
MATTTAISSKVQPHEKDGLMFYRDFITHPAPEQEPEPGAMARFYRFVYPNLPIEQRTHGELLEALVKRNNWLR